MAKRLWTIIISSVIIGVSIITAGNTIADKINMTIYSGSIPVTVTSNDLQSPPADIFLTESEAAAYLKLSDAQFQDLLQAGELSCCYAIIEGQKIFSQNSLSSYVSLLLGNETPKF